LAEPSIVRYRARYEGGFRELVVSVLGEFGFGEDPLIDADLQAPEQTYDAIWLVVDGDSVEGSAAVRLLGGGRAELKRMYLAPGLRGRGLGRRLLGQVVEWAREQRIETLVLDTAVQMTSAQRLYEAAGFRRSGERIEAGEQERRHELLYALDLR
jgi:ribosomal protein S18 acetylase RimI-like enzyme